MTSGRAIATAKSLSFPGTKTMHEKNTKMSWDEDLCRVAKKKFFIAKNNRKDSLFIFTTRFFLFAAFSFFKLDFYDLEKLFSPWIKTVRL